MACNTSEHKLCEYLLVTTYIMLILFQVKKKKMVKFTFFSGSY